MNKWLLEQSTLDMLAKAYADGQFPSAEDSMKYEASRLDGGSPSGEIIAIAGGTARIEVKGILTQRPSFAAMLFGSDNTTYTEIIAALAEADASREVNQIELDISSPGGQFHGLFDALEAIEAVSKPVRAVIGSMGASAAYAIASKADSIEATSIATQVGSVGVVATFSVDDSEVSITSTNAPNKRPDVTTTEGKAVVREELDALEGIFIDAISNGRGVSSATVKADFGRGSTILANEALKRGMIDSIAGRASQNAILTTVTTGGNNQEVLSMDLSTLKSQHPAVYAEAVQDERDRVISHLTLGSAADDMATAIKAIKEGEALTASLQATYMASSINKATVEATAADTEAADTGADVEVKPGEVDTGAEVATLVEAKLGVEVKGAK